MTLPVPNRLLPIPNASPPPTVLHKHAYTTPVQLARRIQHMRRVCNHDTFLNCCVEYNEVATLCAQFAKIVGDCRLEDPDTFFQAYMPDEGV